MHYRTLPSICRLGTLNKTNTQVIIETRHHLCYCVRKMFMDVKITNDLEIINRTTEDINNHIRFITEKILKQD